MGQHLGLNFVQHHPLVSATVLSALYYFFFVASSSFKMRVFLAVLIQIFIILLFITDPEKPVCVVTGLPAKYVFVTPVYAIPLILEFHTSHPHPHRPVLLSIYIFHFSTSNKLDRQASFNVQ